MRILLERHWNNRFFQTMDVFEGYGGILNLYIGITGRYGGAT